MPAPHVPSDASEGKTSLREQAVRQLFDRYIHSLKALVRLQLNVRIRNKVGTSAVVQDALVSFFKKAPDLSDPESVWPLLATITRRKAIDTAKHFTTGKRDIDQELPPPAAPDFVADSRWSMRTCNANSR